MTKIDYQIQLDNKKNRLQSLLNPYYQKIINVFDSPVMHYRMRAEFRLWHESEKLFYVMAPKGEKIRSDTIIPVENFPPAYQTINDLMPLLLNRLEASKVLHQRLFQVEFLATLTGDMLVSLIYHQHLETAWEIEARQLESDLNIAIVGRSRKQKVVLSRDFVRESLTVADKQFHYLQFEQSFSQPNATVCEKMLTWVCEQVDESPFDLLELYCGNGNFTLPLSQYFRRVLATEISKAGIAALRENVKLNQVNNIAVARLSAEEFTQAYQGKREFRRLQQDNIYLPNYQFSTIFVDPPRAGIDSDTLQLLTQFERIIYVSCNPETLARDLSMLNDTHQVLNAALFDQFPFTPHIESGVLLEKREKIC